VTGCGAADDDQDRAGCGGADAVTDAHRARGTAEQPGRGVLHPFHAAVEDPGDVVRPPAAVGELLALGALGDHGADPRVRTGRGKGLLAAHRFPEHGDLADLDTGLARQERYRRGQVRSPHQPKSIACPPERP
jgi:hypothetical protein